PPSSFRLFKWADANKEFADIQSLWIFPEAGMGSATNAYRTAVPSVEVDEEEGVATIYLYAGENGYGVYEFKVSTPNSASIDINKELLNVIVREKTLKFNQQLEFVAVYSVTGQLVVQAKQTSAVEVPQNGIYIVRAKTAGGELAVRKVVVMN
ncbi:MAG: T9SS type A sorting domain-containing protein, partial [Bacteroidales bacterium]|nr:T9SS type A sorting domain-containing protein [Bacteroidales bacterium]